MHAFWFKHIRPPLLEGGVILFEKEVLRLMGKLMPGSPSWSISDRDSLLR